MSIVQFAFVFFTIRHFRVDFQFYHSAHVGSYGPDNKMLSVDLIITNDGEL